MGVSVEVIAAIAELEDRQGRLDAQKVVKAARDEASALHSFFEWDDTEAAGKYRLDQARELIREVRVEITYHEETVRAIRYVHNVDLEQNAGGYINTARIRRESKPAVMAAELERVLDMLRRASEYARLEAAALPRGLAAALAKVEAQLDAATAQVAAMGKRARKAG